LSSRRHATRQATLRVCPSVSVTILKAAARINLVRSTISDDTLDFVAMDSSSVMFYIFLLPRIWWCISDDHGLCTYPNPPQQGFRYPQVVWRSIHNLLTAEAVDQVERVETRNVPNKWWCAKKPSTKNNLPELQRPEHCVNDIQHLSSSWSWHHEYDSLPFVKTPLNDGSCCACQIGAGSRALLVKLHHMAVQSFFCAFPWWYSREWQYLKKGNVMSIDAL